MECLVRVGALVQKLIQCKTDDRRPRGPGHDARLRHKKKLEFLFCCKFQMWNDNDSGWQGGQQRLVFDGKRMRKPIVRKTVDYGGSSLKWQQVQEQLTIDPMCTTRYT